MDIKEAIAFGQYSGHESPQRILAEKVVELNIENARLLANESAMADQICAMVEELSKIREAATAVVDRWETPIWKDVEPTAAFIYRLRDSLP